MSNDKSNCNRRDFLALGALAAATATKTASASSLFEVLLPESSLPVGFCSFQENNLKSADYVRGESVSASVNVTVSGSVQAGQLDDVELLVSYPQASPFRAWSCGGWPIASLSAETSFVVPQKLTKGLELTVTLDRNGLTSKHVIKLGKGATDIGLRPGHYAIMLDENFADWHKYNVESLPAPHIVVSVEAE